jgi:multiple sugar transport system permease protein
MAFQGTKLNPKVFDKSQIKFYLFLIPLALFMILPVVFIINQAFKPLDELFLFPPRFFVNNPTLNNFIELFRTATTTGVPLSRYLFNTFLITVVSVAATIWISVTAGFALSKLRFKAKKSLLTINQIALMFVRVAVVIPTYFIIVNMGLNNNFLVHNLPYLAIPVGLFIVKQYIDQIPDLNI